MAVALKLATASQEIFLGVFVDEVDGYTPETGLTPANTDIKLGVNGATTLANKNSGGATHISGGIYSAVLDATDTATAGPLMIYVKVAGARFVLLECCVYPAKVYDSLFAGTDNLEVDAIQIAGSTTAATRQSQILLDAVSGVSTVQAAPAPTNIAFAGSLTGASYPNNGFRNAALVWLTGSNVGLTPRVCSGFTSSSGLTTISSSQPLQFVPSAGDQFIYVGVAV